MKPGNDGKQGQHANGAPETGQGPAPARSAGSVREEAEWDAVAQASWESFPASDPPAWIRHDDVRPANAS